MSSFMLIAALAPEIELVGAVGEPGLIHALPLALAGGDGRSQDPRELILESVDLHLLARLCRDVEDFQMRLRDVHVAGHGVLVSLERRARICERMDHPQVGYFALIAADHARISSNPWTRRS